MMDKIEERVLEFPVEFMENTLNELLKDKKNPPSSIPVGKIADILNNFLEEKYGKLSSNEYLDIYLHGKLRNQLDKMMFERGYVGFTHNYILMNLRQTL